MRDSQLRFARAVRLGDQQLLRGALVLYVRMCVCIYIYIYIYLYIYREREIDR